MSRASPMPLGELIGVIPQALTSDIDLTVEENLSIYAKLYEVPKAERQRNIDELLEAVDLLKWRNAPDQDTLWWNAAPS